MWIQFFVAVVLSGALLFVPGYVFLRAFKFANLHPVVYAPLVSIFFFCILGAVLPPLGDLGAYTVVGISFGIAMFAQGVAFLVRKKKGAEISEKNNTPRLSYVISILVSAAVLGTTFVVSLNGPDSFSQHSDNMAHLGKIKAMIDSGFFSTFATSSYNAVVDTGQIPFDGAGFYPSAWHIVCALVGSFLNCSPGLAENASNFVFAAFVLPCGMCLLGERISQGDGRFSLTCGVFSCIFAAFPIGLFLFGPLYPNAASYCCLPALLAVFLDLLRAVEEKNGIAWNAVLFIIGSVSVAFLQPNGIFAAAVFLAPYLVHVAPRVLSRYSRFAGTAKGLGAIVLRILVAMLIVIVWLLLNKAPFMQGVVTFNWPAICSLSDAIAGALTLSLRPGVPQYFLAILMWLGFAYTLFNRRYLWLSVVLAFTLFSYVICAATDGPLKMILTGFWYNDQWRASATVYFAAVPLASLGAMVLAKLFKTMLETKGASPVANASALYSFMLVVVVVIVAFPSYAISGEYKKTALGEAADVLVELNNQTEENALTEKEDAFVAKVADYVGNESLVVNFPDDGSAYGYMKYDINLYYKSYLSSGETENSRVIRNGLSLVSSSAEVSSAVDEVGAEYLLLLERNGFVDNGSYQWSLNSSYNVDDWRGILGINDSTPGFEIVLSEGDMRLYRIVGNE